MIKQRNFIIPILEIQENKGFLVKHLRSFFTVNINRLKRKKKHKKYNILKVAIIT